MAPWNGPNYMYMYLVSQRDRKIDSSGLDNLLV